MSEAKTYNQAGDDAKMQQASMDARKTFKFMWRELSWEYRRIIPGLDLAAVKVPFPVDRPRRNQPSVELMWINEIDFDGDSVKGVLINEPQWVSSVEPGDSVSVPLEKIGDWMYAMEGKVYGAFTVNVMRSQMSSRERRAHDQAWGLDFGNPNVIELVRPEKSSGMIGKLFGGGAKPLSAEELQETEHPMSENMEEQVIAMVQENRSVVKDVDEKGWSMLHYESLAGNATPVRILLKAGADPRRKTTSGYSAVALAKKMGWPRILRLFKAWAEKKKGA